jgi:nitrogen fixation protein NifB
LDTNICNPRNLDGIKQFRIMEAAERKTSSHIDKSKHPCFNIEAKSKYGRVHLPVAPKCNVQCNYCNRKYDCVNESRPGVSSTILAPSQAVEYLTQITNRGVNISVVGIAGPGDPFANPEETFETLKLVRYKFPDMLFCLSSNGIDLPQHIEKIKEFNVSHVTITLNAIDPEILSNIYSWVRFNKKIYRGLAAGQIILERQFEAIRLLKENGILIKINTIILPGYNHSHIIEVAKQAKIMGADIMNCIPVYPNKETAFEDIEEPDKSMVHNIQKQISQYIKPMTHCARCRADAAGLLGKDIEDTITLLQETASKPLFATEKRPYVAVASQEGMLVNQHLGEAEDFLIYTNTPEGYLHFETRGAPAQGLGDLRWIQVAKILKDCNSLLVSGAGANPTSLLKSMGLKIIQMNGLIETGLDGVYKGKSLNGHLSTQFKCGSSCSGTGGGCG